MIGFGRLQEFSSIIFDTLINNSYFTWYNTSIRFFVICSYFLEKFQYPCSLKIVFIKKCMKDLGWIFFEGGSYEAEIIFEYKEIIFSVPWKVKQVQKRQILHTIIPTICITNFQIPFLKSRDFLCNLRQKQLSRAWVLLRKGVLKRCSKFTGENPCRSAISMKLLCNFIEITLRHGCSPVNLLHTFRIPFLKNTSGRLLLLTQCPCLVNMSASYSKTHFHCSHTPVLAKARYKFSWIKLS